MNEPIFGGQLYVVEAGPVGAETVVLVHGLGDAGAEDVAKSAEKPQNLSTRTGTCNKQ